MYSGENSFLKEVFVCMYIYVHVCAPIVFKSQLWRTGVKGRGQNQEICMHQPPICVHRMVRLILEREATSGGGAMAISLSYGHDKELDQNYLLPLPEEKLTWLQILIPFSGFSPTRALVRLTHSYYHMQPICLRYLGCFPSLPPLLGPLPYFIMLLPSTLIHSSSHLKKITLLQHRIR
jgi:hypothetical protein